MNACCTSDRYVSGRRALIVVTMWAIGCSVVSVNLNGQVDKTNGPLPFDEAFQLTVGVADEKLVVRWQIEKGYYLYQHALELSVEDESILSKQALPAGSNIDDIVFGNVLVYYDSLEIAIDECSSQAEMTVLVKAQGCQEGVFCYAPRVRSFLIESGNVRELVSQEHNWK